MSSNIPNAADFFNQKVIAGKQYDVVALGAWDALNGATLLAKTLLPVFGEAMDSQNVDEEVAMFEKQNTWREVLTIITTNIHNQEIMQLVNQMLAGCTCDGEAFNIDTHFRGKVHEMVELIIFAVEVNFKGFFTENAMFQSLMGNLGKVMTVSALR